jgi:hypothetical protein
MRNSLYILGLILIYKKKVDRGHFTMAYVPRIMRLRPEFKICRIVEIHDTQLSRDGIVVTGIFGKVYFESTLTGSRTVAPQIR